MLTLEGFRAMAESYGADLRRWPEQSRGDAEALLETAAAEARAILAEARTLDGALARADAMLRLPGGEDAALARLRARVAARIAAPAEHRLEALKAAILRRLPWLPPFGLGLAAGSGLAIMAGLLIGALYTAAPSSDSLLGLLQPAPIHVFED